MSFLDHIFIHFISYTSQVILPYKLPPKTPQHPKSSFQQKYCHNSEKLSKNYQQHDETPLLVVETFRGSILKPYAASLAKKPETCFH